MSTASANSHNGTPPDGISIDEAAERVGVAVTTLRRWAREGLFPRYDGSWSVVEHARRRRVRADRRRAAEGIQ
jgi:predicted site-specific integrase-resolvase